MQSLLNAGANQHFERKKQTISDQITHLHEGAGQNKELVRGSVEETLNEPLGL